ncbi:MAG: hypothetical protein WCD54_23945, partial [Pseudolabrys sp.]
ALPGRSVLHRGEQSQRAQTHRIGRLPFGAAHGSRKARDGSGDVPPGDNLPFRGTLALEYSA